jgi:hypothetical protein
MQIPANTANDGVQLRFAGNSIAFMDSSCDLAGIVVLSAAAANGTGQGTINVTPAGLTWQAPHSGTPGTPQACRPDGEYLLIDGEDESKFIKVAVYNDYLPATGGAPVLISDTFNAFGPDDVTASQASSGNTSVATFTFANVSGNAIVKLTAWLSPFVSGVTISSDGVNFYDPVSSGDADALQWPSVGLASNVPIYLKRVISAGTASMASILNHLCWAWVGA